MRHPAENFIKYLLLRDGGTIADADLLKILEDWSILGPHEHYLSFLRAEVEAPEGFNPADRSHRASVNFLRDQGVYELFFPNEAMTEAWSIMANRQQREVCEQVLLSRIDPKIAAQRVNKARSWFLTAAGIKMFGHCFWNVPKLSFDEWGKYLYSRSQMYERYMALLNSSPQLAFFHLRLEQTLDSKKMIQRAQEIAYFNLEEVNAKPGTGADKIKAIGLLTKSIVECHNSLSTSDMAMKDVLKQFEQFRMQHPLAPPPDIKSLAPAGNFSGSGVDVEKKEPEKVH